MKIVIIDYGMGNIKSISSALKYLGVGEVIVSSRFADISLADKLILPGVGSFAKAVSNIKTLNIGQYIQDAVYLDKKPILGICLGMQLMGMGSDEDGLNDGLRFVPGVVRKFNSHNLKIPHVGFNQVNFNDNSRLFKGLINLSDFYFTHSYKMQCGTNINQSSCTYGDDFIASFEIDNIAGVQFHPELSQTNGLKLLENFIETF